MVTRNPIPELSKLEQVDLREIWRHEAGDFTQWLAEKDNLALLSDSLGIDLECDETESGVGSFNVDILAHEVGTSRSVIIENQLEDSNHDHLGKIITYAAGKDASVIVWIVKKAREEHAKAIEWLNSQTGTDVAFFLVELQAWRIGNSLPAPRFDVIERPNDWAKTMRTSDELSALAKAQLEYWSTYRELAEADAAFSREFNAQKPGPQNWTNLAIGFSDVYLNLVINSTDKWIGAGIYCNSLEALEVLRGHIEELEAMLGCQVEISHGEKHGRIIAKRGNSDFRKRRESWSEFISWQIEKALIFKEFVLKHKA